MHTAAANELLLRYLRDHFHGPERLADCAAAEVDTYTDLGTHPDVSRQLWHTLGGALPEDCARVVHGTPVLAHARTGVIFAFAGGAGYALRLPPAALALARAAGATTLARSSLGDTLDLTRFGPGWIWGRYLADEAAWCRAAFQHAARDASRDRW